MLALAQVDLTPALALVEAQQLSKGYAWQALDIQLAFQGCVAERLTECLHQHPPMGLLPRHPMLSGALWGVSAALLLKQHAKWLALGLGGYLLLEQLKA